MGTFLLVSFGFMIALLLYLALSGKKQQKSGATAMANNQPIKRNPPIPCPECGNSVSTAAAFCPHCGLPSGKASTLPVIVTDLNMDFGSMVVFLVKIVIAAIPAIFILFLIGLTLAMVFGLAGSLSR